MTDSTLATPDLATDLEFARDVFERLTPLLAEGPETRLDFARVEGIAGAIDAMASVCHAEAADAGWWDNPREDGTIYALMHSEVSEGLEANRKSLASEKLHGVSGEGEELADLLIRVLDYCGRNQIPVGTIALHKILYNRERLDHTPEARAADGGKKY